MILLLKFLVILAWIGFAGGLFVTAMRIWGAISTTELDRDLARARGFERTHPIKTSGTIMIVCGAFLLAHALT